jgi:hypothetical protein
MMKVGRSDDRYPEMDSSYQSTNVPGLYFAGTLTHGFDKGKSAGGFIHGFRYVARALSRMLMATEEEPWPTTPVACIDTSKHAAVQAMSESINDRLGTSSGLYQMQSELQDVYAFQGGCLIRYEEVPRRYTAKLADQLPQDAALFTVTFRYNENFSNAKRDPFASDRVQKITIDSSMPKEGKLAYEVMPNGWNTHNFLHPVVETVRFGNFSSCEMLRKEAFHLTEDLETIWGRAQDTAPLVEWLLVRTMSNPCEFDLQGQDADFVRGWWAQMVEAVFGRKVEYNKSDEKNALKDKDKDKEGLRQVEIDRGSVNRVDRGSFFKSLK